MNLDEFWSRLRGVFRRNRPDPDFDDEIASHLEFAKADAIRRGLSEAEAERLAAIQFGSTTAARERVWEQRRLPWIDTLLRDAQYAARGMRRNPGFTLVTLGTLSIGIGLCSVIYSTLMWVVLRPVPGIPEPERLAVIDRPVPYSSFEAYRESNNTSWSAAAFLGPVPITLGDDRATGLLVSPEYFTTLAVQPLLGRFFDPVQEQKGTPASVVLTEHFWRTRLRSDPQAIGRTLRINGRTLSIVGVAQRDFYGAGAVAFSVPDLFLPATANPSPAPELRDGFENRPSFQVLLRLATGVTIAGVESQLDAETRRLHHSGENKGRLIRLFPAGSLIPLPPEGRALFVLFYGVLMFAVLGLTCANLGGLLLARGAARVPEFAIRLSIGADRRRLVRQLLTESALLAVAGGAGGLLCAHAIFAILRSIQTLSNPVLDSFTRGPDLQAAGFSFAIAIVAAAGFGLLPALAVTRLDLTAAMKPGRIPGLPRYRPFGLRNFFVVGQVAAAMMLVLVMGFVVVGTQYGPRTDPGFDTAPVSFFSLDPARDGLAPAESAELLGRLPERLRRIPGVVIASLADRPPLDNTYPTTPVSVPGGGSHGVVLQSAGPAYFSALDARILRGVDFQQREMTSGPRSAGIVPAAINQTAASELFGSQDPLGLRIQHDGHEYQVAAVVRYAPRAMLMGRPIATVFVPLDTHAAASGITVVLRWRASVDMAAVRRAVADLDSRLTVFQPNTLTAAVADLESKASKAAALYTPIGLFGLVLACLGLAGVTAQTVQRRKKEIGIRTAMGARRSQVLRLVMGESAAMVLVGSAIGYAAATAFARALSAVASPVAQLIAPVASNWALTAGVPSLLIALAIASCYLPARRSAGIDPLNALREE